MSQMTVEELNNLIRREFPQSKVILETISPRRCCVRIPINSSHLRPVEPYLTDHDEPRGQCTYLALWPK